MAWDPNLTSLNHVLAALYPLQEQSVRIVQEAGIPTGLVAFQSRALDNWHRILDEAVKQGKVAAVINAARRDYPEYERLKEAEAGQLAPPPGPILDAKGWRGTFDPGSVEKLMGAQSTLLHVSFLELGVERSRSVARVVTPGGLGSGFLTTDNLFVTNHHVIGTKDEAKATKIQFNFQQKSKGLDARIAEFTLDPDSAFATSPMHDHDWTIVRVCGNPTKEWGAIEVKQTNVSHTRWVNIIQHPGGGPKQVALYHNLVSYVDENVVQYLTDTLPGSSGSPVFDSEWNVVAVHHSGGWIVEPGTKKAVYRNEGIHVNQIAVALAPFRS